MISRQFFLLFCAVVIVFSFREPGVDVNKELVIRVDVSVKERDSVTLYNDVKANTDNTNVAKWYFYDNRIASIHGDHRKICTDKLCPERFRDRLKVDSHAGDLTVTNITTEHAGVYQLQIICQNRSTTFFNVTVQAVPAAERDEIKRKSVKEGESVTLDSGVIKNPDDSVTWYFSDTLITEIPGDQSQICTDDQCEERFRDRLKLDHQTGSLTITNITTTDSGVYILKITVRIRRRRHSITSVKSFRVAVIGSGLSSAAVAGIVVVVVLLVSAAAAGGVIYYRHRTSESINDVPAAERDKMRKKSVMEGESVTLDPGEPKNPSDVMTCHFNDTLITEIPGDQSQICTDDQCDERFRDRLKLDHQTGSLNITNTRTEDSGLYKLQINNSRFSIIRSFSIMRENIFSATVTSSGLSAAAVAGMVVLLVSAAAAGGVIYYRHRRSESINADVETNEQELLNEDKEGENRKDGDHVI